MLRIRFFRKGRKKQPFYKIIVTDKNNPPNSGRFVEDVGFYNPLTKDCKIEKEKVLFWIEKGAQPSDTVKNLLINKKIIEGEKVNVVSFSKKRKEKINSKKEKDGKKEEVSASEEKVEENIEHKDDKKETGEKVEENKKSEEENKEESKPKKEDDNKKEHQETKEKE